MPGNAAYLAPSPAKRQTSAGGRGSVHLGALRHVAPPPPPAEDGPPPPPTERKAPLPFGAELVKKGVNSIISSSQDLTASLKHVNEAVCNDRSGPRLEEGVVVRSNPAVKVFAEITHGVTLRPVYDIDQHDRSAPMIQTNVTIRRDVRPSLFSELKSMFGFASGPTGAGKKRMWD